MPNSLSHGLVRNDIVVDLYCTRVFLVKSTKFDLKVATSLHSFLSSPGVESFSSSRREIWSITDYYYICVITNIFCDRFPSRPRKQWIRYKNLYTGRSERFKHKRVLVVEITDLLEYKTKSQNLYFSTESLSVNVETNIVPRSKTHA